MNDSSKLIGENGSYYYDSTATLTGHWYAVECNADTVFSVLTETGAVNAITGQNLTSKTISQGVILTPNKENFISIALTSGSVILRNA